MSRPYATGWPAWHLVALVAPAVIGTLARVLLLRFADLIETGDNALDVWADE